MKKLDERGFHVWIIILIVVVVIALGFGGWYVWDAQKDDEASETATPTPTPTPTVAAVDYLGTLRDFCENFSDSMVVGSVQFVDNNYGQFGSCGLSDPSMESGGMLIAAYVDGAWEHVFDGNGIMDLAQCDAYHLPSSIYGDCPGFYE